MKRIFVIVGVLMMLFINTQCYAARYQNLDDSNSVIVSNCDERIPINPKRVSVGDPGILDIMGTLRINRLDVLISNHRPSDPDFITYYRDEIINNGGRLVDLTSKTEEEFLTKLKEADPELIIINDSILDERRYVILKEIAPVMVIKYDYEKNTISQMFENIERISTIFDIDCSHTNTTVTGWINELTNLVNQAQGAVSVWEVHNGKFFTSPLYGWVTEITGRGYSGLNKIVPINALDNYFSQEIENGNGVIVVNISTISNYNDPIIKTITNSMAYRALFFVDKFRWGDKKDWFIGSYSPSPHRLYKMLQDLAAIYRMMS